MLDLVQQGRQPGQVEKADAAEADGGVTQQAAAVVARHGEHGEREQSAGGDEQPPVVCVEHRRENDDEEGQVAAVAVDVDVQEGRGDEQAEDDHQRVHPDLLGVGGQEAVEREQRGADVAGASPEEAPARPQPAGDGEERDGHGEPLALGGPVPEDPGPDAQQHVVEGRRAVHPEDVRDVEQGLRGDPDREPLIHPEGLAQRPCVVIEREGGEPHQDERRNDDPRWERPGAGEGSRTRGYGGHGAQRRSLGTEAVGAYGLPFGQGPPLDGGTVNRRHFP